METENTNRVDLGGTAKDVFACWRDIKLGERRKGLAWSWLTVLGERLEQDSRRAGFWPVLQPESHPMLAPNKRPQHPWVLCRVLCVQEAGGDRVRECICAGLGSCSHHASQPGTARYLVRLANSPARASTHQSQHIRAGPGTHPSHPGTQGSISPPCRWHMATAGKSYTYTRMLAD